jgi:hypothetical protein
VGPSLLERALVIGWGGAAAGTGFANSSKLFLLGLLATHPHLYGAGWIMVVLGGGGGGGSGKDLNIDFGVSSSCDSGWAENPYHADDRSLP